LTRPEYPPPAGVSALNRTIRPEIASVRTRTYRQPINCPSGFSHCSVLRNYYQEPSKDRRPSGAIDSISTIIVDNSATTNLQGAVDRFSAGDPAFQRSHADARPSSGPPTPGGPRRQGFCLQPQSARLVAPTPQHLNEVPISWLIFLKQVHGSFGPPTPPARPAPRSPPPGGPWEGERGWGDPPLPGPTPPRCSRR
jgi:hypothetical protein